jgi:hypothetical protein
LEKYQSTLRSDNEKALNQIRARISGDTKDLDYGNLRSQFASITGSGSDPQDLTNYLNTLQSDKTLKELSLKKYDKLEQDLLTWIKKMKGRKFPGTQTLIKDFTTDAKFSSLQAIFDDINDATQ